MVPSDSSEPPRSEVSKVKWFTEGVSFTLTREDFVHFVPSGVNFMQEQHSLCRIFLLKGTQKYDNTRLICVYHTQTDCST